MTGDEDNEDRYGHEDQQPGSAGTKKQGAYFIEAILVKACQY